MKLLSRVALSCLLSAVLALSAAGFAGAMTFDQAAQQVTGIPSSTWASGSLGQTYGTNCSTAILGSSYPEVMEMAYSSYGGKPGTVRVGDSYWARIHLAVTGNPCPKGSDIISIDLAMPPGTSYDGTRPIRCFSTPRNSDNYYESTNENWDMRPIGINAYGKTCASGPTPSATGYGVGFDFRGLASGQNFVMYVPVKSTQALVGMGNSEHRFVWLINPSLAYNYFGAETWANVMPAGPSSPYIYFTREPAVVPFWSADAPAGQENRIELFANLFSNSQPGAFCYKIYNGPTTAGTVAVDCLNFGSTIDSSSDSWFVQGPGPNGGAVPFYWDPPEYDKTYTIQWYFDPTVGPTIYSTPITFHSLAGPDDDADGVPNDGTDQCPGQSGPAPSGCPASIAASADPDGDGVIGLLDKCPNLGMIGVDDGCPTLTAGLGKLPVLKRKKLAKGVKLPVNCSLDSPVSLQLTVSASVARKLKLKVAKKARSVTIGSAKGSCTKAAGAKLNLKLSKAARKRVTRSKKTISATLQVAFTPTGGVKPVATKKSVKLK